MMGNMGRINVLDRVEIQLQECSLGSRVPNRELLFLGKCNELYVVN